MDELAAEPLVWAAAVFCIQRFRARVFFCWLQLIEAGRERVGVCWLRSVMEVIRHSVWVSGAQLIE